MKTAWLHLAFCMLLSRSARPLVRPHAPAFSRVRCHAKLFSTLPFMSSSSAASGVFGAPALSASVSGFLDYVNASPSPFHACTASMALLDAAGFARISETATVGADGSPAQDAFAALQPGGKYYFTRNQSTIVAFAVGGKFQPGNGVHMVAAHTDSPCFKLKPKSKLQQNGFVQIGVECYGGGLWYTWFDRDLSVAGRVIVANADNTAFESKLVRIDHPLLKIPSLAIHLNRSVNDEGFKLNKEKETAPIIATVAGVLNGPAEFKDDAKAPASAASAFEATSKHHPLLIGLLARQLGVAPAQIRDFELSLFDTQAAVVGGAFNEFIFSARLDNLLMSYVSIEALCASVTGSEAETGLANETNVRLVALFDHEECGSGSAQGAASNMLVQTLARINRGTHVDSSARRSFLVSADMAHALHPNYPEKHESNHRPMMNQGLVFKENSNQRYATNAATSFALNEIARRHAIAVQDFCVRNDAMCGSTVGPILAANCGVRCVDVGVPQFGMHSIRETCGVADVESSSRLLTHFFRDFSALDATVKVDL